MGFFYFFLEMLSAFLVFFVVSAIMSICILIGEHISNSDKEYNE